MPSPRVMVLILAILLMVSSAGVYFFLVAGGQSSEQTDPTDTEGEITWWGFEDPSVYQPLIDAFEAENPNTNVNYVVQSKQDYRVRLNESLARGDGPDVFTYHNTWVPMFRSNLDNMPSFVMSADDFSSTFYPVAVSDLTTDKGIVGMPLEYNALTMFINEDIFATAGKIPPQQWDELKEVSQELTQRDNRGVITQSGIALGYTENVDYWQDIVGLMIIQNFADPAKPASERARDALLYYRSFRNDKVWDTTLPPSMVAFARGDVAMAFGTIESTSIILELNPDLFFRTVDLPQLRKDNPDEPDISYATYWVQGVWSRSESRGVAWRFLEFMSRPESLRQVYANKKAIKGYAHPYPRIDMAPLLENDPLVGSIVRLAPGARSWYLAALTNDGDQGLNSRLGAIYEDMLVRVSNLEKFADEIQTVLVEYKLANPVQPRSSK